MINWSNWVIPMLLTRVESSMLCGDVNDMQGTVRIHSESTSIVWIRFDCSVLKQFSAIMPCSGGAVSQAITGESGCAADSGENNRTTCERNSSINTHEKGNRLIVDFYWYSMSTLCFLSLEDTDTYNYNKNETRINKARTNHK